MKEETEMASILEMAKHATMEQAKLIVKDAGYVPEEKLGWCAMGCAKTARFGKWRGHDYTPPLSQ